MRVLLIAVLLSFASATLNIIGGGSYDAGATDNSITATDAKLISVQALASKRVQCANKDDGAHCVSPNNMINVVYQ